MVKHVFIKAQAASLIASGVDFLMTVFFVEVLQLKAVLAAALGTISGGMVNFSLGRYWVFKSATKPIPMQALKYLVVWIGNLLLNIGGMTIMIHYVHANYMVSKILVSLLVGVFYNYLLQGKFVFK
jgi:putative flippase GtrA